MNTGTQRLFLHSKQLRSRRLLATHKIGCGVVLAELRGSPGEGLEKGGRGAEEGERERAREEMGGFSGRSRE